MTKASGFSGIMTASSTQTRSIHRRRSNKGDPALTAQSTNAERSSIPAVTRLSIGGIGLCGDGYPNAPRTVALLRHSEKFDVTDCGGWLPEDFHLWKLTRMPRWRAVGWICALVIRNLRSLVRLVAKSSRDPLLVYVPYPAAFFMLLVSFMPRRWRPKCIVDAYISIWDSTFQDRRVGAPAGVASRTIKWIEQRALSAATLVLVDTGANRDYLVATFNLDPARVRSLPLAIDQELFQRHGEESDRRTRERIRVLFVGTLIPLHGIGTILDALRLLVTDVRFEFRLIGDGQDGALVEEFMRVAPSNVVTWVREWCPLQRIADEIAEADICLGVFGGDAKAARVLPFKLYMYLAAGKAIVSQHPLSVPSGIPSPPIEAVAAGDGIGLANALRGLAAEPERRGQMGRTARDYFDRWLSSAEVLKRWEAIARDPGC